MLKKLRPEKKPKADVRRRLKKAVKTAAGIFLIDYLIMKSRRRKRVKMIPVETCDQNLFWRNRNHNKWTAK
jgi:hypothetical protein